MPSCASRTAARLSACLSVRVSVRLWLPAVPRSGGVPAGSRPLLGKQVTLPRQLLLCACLNCPSQLAVIRDSVKMSKHSAFISPGGPRPPSWQPREIPRAPLPRMPSASRPAKGKLMASRSKSLPEIILFCPRIDCSRPGNMSKSIRQSSGQKRHALAPFIYPLF